MLPCLGVVKKVKIQIDMDLVNKFILKYIILPTFFFQMLFKR